MTEQIAANKRRTVVHLGAFVVAWLGIGMVIGWLAAAVNQQPAQRDVLVGAVIAVLAAAAGVVFALRSGTRVVLGVAGAHMADRRRYPQVYNLVEALAIGEGIPAPAVYVVDDPSPNAFATGISPGRAAVTVTAGLLDTMNREELEGVLAPTRSVTSGTTTRGCSSVRTSRCATQGAGQRPAAGSREPGHRADVHRQSAAAPPGRVQPAVRHAPAD
jgi:heat shock protein HtpX